LIKKIRNGAILSFLLLFVLSACGTNEASLKSDSQQTGIEQSTLKNVETDQKETESSIIEASDQVKSKQPTASTEKPKAEEEAVLQDSHPVDETVSESQTTYWRIDGGDANIREEADYDSPSLFIGKEGQDLAYLHVKYVDPQDSRIWYNVKSREGKIGWISSAVVAESDGNYFANGPESETKDSDDTTFAAASQYFVLQEANIRHSPSIDSEVVDTALKGTQLESLNAQHYDSGDGRTWYHVQTSSGFEGWVSSKVVRTEDSFTSSDDSNIETTGIYYENCAAAEAAGAAPVYEGDPGYASWLDRDSDGIGCEISDWDSYDGGYSGSSDASASNAGSVVYFKNCTAARAAGAAPVYAGDPGYSRKLDRDGDGIGCE